MTSLVDLDWLIDDGDEDTPLHALKPRSPWGVYEAFEEAEWQTITTACGLTQRMGIPGIFTRMGAMRCEECCDVLGYPHGKGSPKNDDACRAILGIEPLLTPEEAAAHLASRGDS